MAKYKLTQTDVVIDTEENAWIPNDPQNRHRIAYQKWVRAGNTPDPADPPPPVELPPVVPKPDPTTVSVPAIRDTLREVVQVLQDRGLLRESS